MAGTAVSVDLTAAAGGNFIATLGPFATGNGFALSNSRALTVVGAVRGGTGVAIDLAGASSDLVVDGAITATIGNIDLTAARNITLGADISAALGTISLMAPGVIDQIGGTLTAAVLTGPARCAAGGVGQLCPT